MPSKSKTKGNSFEREVVNQARALGFKSERAWGSDGRSRGWHEEVDLIISTPLSILNFQCKRRAKLPAYVKPNRHVDAQLIREDRGDTLVVLPLNLLFTLLTAIKKEEENVLPETEETSHTS